MRYQAEALVAFAQAVLRAKGMESHIAHETAQVLVEGDLLGHTTHGLQLLPRYLDAISRGHLSLRGEPQTISDTHSSFVWDGGYLPGAYLVRAAIREARNRLSDHPAITVVIRRSGHIGCLAVYALEAAEQGCFLILCSSDPAVAPVAPHGATEGKLTPNPIAAGWPTEGDPVFLDVCPSSTTAGMVGRAGRTGVPLGGEWLVGEDGVPTADAGVMNAPRGGAILPLGGVELGHKGFALALLVEALTAGLGGLGRADGIKQDGAAVWFQLIDPAGFAGGAAFRRETSWLAADVVGARPMPGGPPVRMPGARGLELKRRQLAQGVTLHPDTQREIGRLAVSAGLPLPSANEEV